VGLSSPGIGSNLDVNGIVSKLMSVERQPLTTLDSKEASFQAKLSGFGTLKGALSQFQTSVGALSNISQFQAVRVTAGDATIVSASAVGAATPGTYALEVTKLAQVQKLAAAGQASDSAAIGNGVISFDLGVISGGSFDAPSGKYTGASFTTNGAGIKTVTIDDSNHSLSGIRDAINKANIGIAATIVNDGGTSPYRLVLTNAVSGKTSSLKISVTGDAPLAALLAHNPGSAPGSQAFSETLTAQNAEFKIDGIAVSKGSNTVSDAITGVTLNLGKTNVGSTTNITVARDTASLLTSVNAFVKAYNDISQTLRDAGAYNATTKQASILNGEASVRTIQTQIRNVLTTPVAGGASAFSRLSSVGVTLQKDGLLAVDSTKLQAAMDSNFNDLAGLFAASGKTSDALVAYSSASSKTAPGAYSVTISKLATKGNTVGDVGMAGLDINALNDSLQVQLDGVTATITLAHATPGPAYASAAALAAEIQSKINGAAGFVAAGSSATVTESGGRLTITSNRFGSASNVSVTGGTGQANLNFGGGAAIIAGLDTAGTINGVAASGSGQLLTGAIGDASEGMSLKISGGSTGIRGTVNYSQGYAYQFNKLATTLLGADGPIASRTDGINASIKSLTHRRQDISVRLAGIEKRYRDQFTSLDVAISSMNTTSNFLTQQLANLSKNSV
jgi:flagellar hook-associated protein 2